MISIQIGNLPAVKKQLAEIPEKIERHVILRLSQIIHDEAQRGADSHTKTGALFRSIYNRSIPGGREVGADPKIAPHAIFVHWGTKPHTIAPKNRRALRFQPNGGPFVFAKRVRHPGYRGDPFLTRAADVALRQMEQIVNEALKGV